MYIISRTLDPHYRAEHFRDESYTTTNVNKWPLEADFSQLNLKFLAKFKVINYWKINF